MVVNSGHWTHPMQADDQFVAVVLVLVCAGLDGEVRVAPGDPRQEEVDHGPQLLQGVLQRSVDEEEPLLTGTHTHTHTDTQINNQTGLSR